MQTQMQFPKFLGNGRIEWSSKEIPTPGRGQLLIKVIANSLCGSDRGQFFSGSDVTPGHEVSGIVHATGADSTISIGTPGVVYLMQYCGKCDNCQSGYTNQCTDKEGDVGFNMPGGYEPYILVNENTFFPIDSDLDLVEATTLLDIMGTGGHAIKRAQLLHPNIKSLLIGGAGPIGLGVLAMAKLLLGENTPVFVTDYVEFRLELARKLGGTPIYLKDRAVSAELGKHGLTSVDVAIDTTGKTSARHTALNVLNKRGVLVCVGHGEDLNLHVSSDLIAPERAVLGSEYFTFSELNDNAKYIRSHGDYLSAIITHRIPIKELQSGYEQFFTGQTGKVVAVHDEQD